MSKSQRTGCDVSLVLGAGGARGLAHIGAIEMLEQRGYRIVARPEVKTHRVRLGAPLEAAH